MLIDLDRLHTWGEIRQIRQNLPQPASIESHHVVGTKMLFRIVSIQMTHQKSGPGSATILRRHIDRDEALLPGGDGWVTTPHRRQPLVCIDSMQACFEKMLMLG